MTLTVATNDTPLVNAKRVENSHTLKSDAKSTAADNEGSSCPSDADEFDTTRDGAMRRRLSRKGSVNDTYLREMLGSSLANGVPSPQTLVRRSQSCGVHGARDATYRMRITYHDELLRERCERNTHQLLQTAFGDATNADSTSAILARKALRYRKILQRMEASNVDVHDPAFDASECLGVRWHRVGSQ